MTLYKWEPAKLYTPYPGVRRRVRNPYPYIKLNFSVPVSLPYLNSKSNFSPYSFLTSGSKISPYPSPYPYFILKYFLSSVPVPVPVLFPYPFRTLILYHFFPCAVFQDIDILSVYFLSKFRTRTPIFFFSPYPYPYPKFRWFRLRTVSVPIIPNLPVLRTNSVRTLGTEDGKCTESVSLLRGMVLTRFMP